MRKAVPEFTARMHDGMFQAQHKGEDVDFGVWAKNKDGSEDWGLAFSAMHQRGISSNCFVYILYDQQNEREVGLREVLCMNHHDLQVLGGSYIWLRPS